MATEKIMGRIIRILDPESVIINLGRVHGIKDEYIFSILGEKEAVVDPFTKEQLGIVKVVKAKVAARQVYDRFTIAGTKWTRYANSIASIIGRTALFGGAEQVDQGVLRVRTEDLKPWKSQSEEPVVVGDVVEVAVAVPDSRPDGPSVGSQPASEPGPHPETVQPPTTGPTQAAGDRPAQAGARSMEENPT